MKQAAPQRHLQDELAAAPVASKPGQLDASGGKLFSSRPADPPAPSDGLPRTSASSPASRPGSPADPVSAASPEQELELEGLGSDDEFESLWSKLTAEGFAEDGSSETKKSAPPKTKPTATAGAPQPTAWEDILAGLADSEAAVSQQRADCTAFASAPGPAAPAAAADDFEMLWAEAEAEKLVAPAPVRRRAGGATTSGFVGHLRRARVQAPVPHFAQKPQLAPLGAFGAGQKPAVLHQVAAAPAAVPHRASAIVPAVCGDETVGAAAALLSPAFAARCGWREILALAAVSKAWREATFGRTSAEHSWHCMCSALAAERALYIPADYARGWKTLFFEQLWPARAKWGESMEHGGGGAAGLPQDFKIQVGARFRPLGSGDTDDGADVLLLPLRQRLKLLKPGERLPSSAHCGLPVSTVRELLATGVLESGADLPAEVIQALMDAHEASSSAERAANEADQDAAAPAEEDRWGAGGGGMAAAEEEAAAQRPGAAVEHEEREAAAGGPREDEEELGGGGGGEAGMKKRRHGNARLLSVQQGKAVMYVPGQGFRPFHFGAVFGEDSGQEAVWRQSAHDAVIGALNGFNACLICYGQTGSGKTHTVFGPDGILDKAAALGALPGEAGITLRAVAEVVDGMAASNAAADSSYTTTVTASYVEIYNEQITDLLDGQAASVRGDALQASVSRVESLSDAVELLRVGEARKSRAATKMNDRSSRAHTVLLLKIKQADRHADKVVHSSLALVDLAGSEQLKQSGAVGQQRREAIGINSSLMVLRKCIAALVKRKPHVPYYESKLTSLLRPALGGGSRTTVLITASRASSNGEQTMQALRFGEDCSAIVNAATLAGASSITAAIKEVDAALENCSAGMAGLRERGKTALPSYKRLEAQYGSLLAKRSEMAGLEEAAAGRRGEERSARRGALERARTVAHEHAPEPEEEVAVESGRGGGLFIPF